MHLVVLIELVFVECEQALHVLFVDGFDYEFAHINIYDEYPIVVNINYLILGVGY